MLLPINIEACCTLDDFSSADILVLKGDCLDANGKGGGLESNLVSLYLLSHYNNHVLNY